jgi:hypothetical protein
MERLDQGHLQSKLEVPARTDKSPTGNRTRASTMGGEHYIKEPFEKFVNGYSEH